MKRLTASILSFLILSLSAGGGGVPVSVSDNLSNEETCCCGCCGGDAVPQGEGALPRNDDGQSTHKACPFCISNTCPGFAAAFFADMPDLLTEDDYGQSVFIPHGYIQPFVGGVWQPPWYV